MQIKPSDPLKLSNLRKIDIGCQKFRTHGLCKKNQLGFDILRASDLTLLNTNINMLDSAQIIQDLQTAPPARLLDRIIRLSDAL